MSAAFFAAPAVPVAAYALRDLVRALRSSRRVPQAARPRHVAQAVR